MAVFFSGEWQQEQPQNAIKSVQFAADEGTTKLQEAPARGLFTGLVYRKSYKLMFRNSEHSNKVIDSDIRSQKEGPSTLKKGNTCCLVGFCHNIGGQEEKLSVLKKINSHPCSPQIKKNCWAFCWTQWRIPPQSQLSFEWGPPVRVNLMFCYRSFFLLTFGWSGTHHREEIHPMYII